MGPDIYSYLHYENSGNHCVGITITGLWVLFTDFGFYSSYFDTEGEEYGIAKEEAIGSFIR